MQRGKQLQVILSGRENDLRGSRVTWSHIVDSKPSSYEDSEGVGGSPCGEAGGPTKYQLRGSQSSEGVSPQDPVGRSNLLG
jgi:hypothetical protein